jgi:hypothetical protein
MSSLRLKPIVVAFGGILVAIAMSVSANASSLRQGSTAGGAVSGNLPGQVLWGYYDTFGGLGAYAPLLPTPTAVTSAAPATISFD